MEKLIKTSSAIYSVTDCGKVFTQSIYKIPLNTVGREFSGIFKEILKPKRELTKRINNRGYYSVILANSTKMIHRLVCEHFLSNPLNKPFVNHKDGNKLNNHISNLEWCTHKENMEHAFATGLFTKEGRENSIKALIENNPNPRLPDCAIDYIRTNFKKRCPVNGAQSLSKKFNVSTTTISYIVNRKKSYANI